MSIKMIPGSARLTVLGTGWSNASFESGDGLTEEGKLWEDIAGDLGYDFGSDVDWDQIASDGTIVWSDVIYTDADGVIYTDLEGTGVWTSEDGTEYDGNGYTWVSELQLSIISDGLAGVSANDHLLSRYAIPNSVLRTLYGGKVTQEGKIVSSGSDRPHYYSPGVYYIQENATNAVLFLDEPFRHTAAGGTIQVYDEAVTIRKGDTKSVYWSDCSTFFTDNMLPSEYKSIPIQYICWQCLHGSFQDTLVSTGEKTITTEMIQTGVVDMVTMPYGGITWYKIKT